MCESEGNINAAGPPSLQSTQGVTADEGVGWVEQSPRAYLPTSTSYTSPPRPRLPACALSSSAALADPFQLGLLGETAAAGGREGQSEGGEVERPRLLQYHQAPAPPRRALHYCEFPKECTFSTSSAVFMFGPCHCKLINK